MTFQKKNIIVLMLAGILAASLVSCGSSGGGSGGGGGAGADSITLSIDGGAATSFIETSESYGRSEPYIRAYTDYNPFQDLDFTKIYMYWELHPGGGYGKLVEIMFYGLITGNYDASLGYVQGAASCCYSDLGTADYCSQTGLVTVTRHDNALDGMVQGTFDCDLTTSNIGVPPTMTISGSFSATLVP